MAFTDSTIISYKTASGVVSLSSIDESGSQRDNSPVTVPASTSNYHAPRSVDVSQLISFLIYSSQNVTVKTNSSSSPAQTFTLVAGIGLTWNNANGQSNPLTTDITDLYVTNLGSVAAVMQFSFLKP